MKTLLVFISTLAVITLSVLSSDVNETTDGELSRKILGSSVVTSVSVIMDNGNGSKTIYTDAVGKPISKPANSAELASPINLLNPDRYEFYTFDDNGDLVKRLMSLEEIKGIIATGDSDGLDFDSFTSQGYLPEKRVNEVVNTVQNVLKGEIETHKNTMDANLTLDTPDVSDSWSMILPAVFGNSGEDIKPEKPIIHVTPDTIMLEPDSPEITVLSSQKIGSSTIKTSEMSTLQPKEPVTASVKIQDYTISTQSPNDNMKLTSNSQQSNYSTPLPSVTPTLTPSSVANEELKTLPPSEILIPSTYIINTTTQNYKAPTTVQVTGTESTTPEPSFMNTETSVMKEQFSTWIPSLANLNRDNSEVTSTNTEGLTTFYDTSNEKIKTTEKQTTEETKPYPTTDKSSNEDLNTMSTEYIGYQGNIQNIFKETIPLEQAMSDAEKISASALLDQLLLTTNVYEINTELSQNSLNKLNTDQRFDISTQKFPEFVEKETEFPTTEKFLIKVNDQQPLEHNNLIQSIDQLLSQAVNNVEELITSVNNTEKIQQLLNKSSNMAQSQYEAATVASDMIDEIFYKNPEQTTISQSNGGDIKETVGSQLYESTTLNNFEETKQTVASSLFNNDSDNISRTESYILDGFDQTTQVTTVVNDLQEFGTNWTITRTEEENKRSNQSNMPFKTNDMKVENMPPLINITIITPENTKYKVKPSTVGTNLDKLHYKSENSDKNNTDGESTEIYIESMFDVIKPINVPIKKVNTTKVSQELADVQQSVETTTSIETTAEAETETTKTESSYTTQTEIDSNLISANKLTTLSLNDDKPTTIIIIKRTERPPQQEITTIVPETTEQTTSTEASTHLISTIDSGDRKNEEPTLIDLISLFPSTEKDNQQITTLVTETNSPNKSTSITEGDKDSNQIQYDESVNFTLETNIPTEKLTVAEDQSSITNDIKQKINESNTEKVKNENSQKVAFNKTSIENNAEQPESTWTLVPTIAPHADEVLQNAPPPMQHFSDIIEPPSPIDLGPNPMQGFGLEESTTALDTDIYQFTQLCNELAFGFWKTVTNGISSARSVFVSPFGVTSLLAMVFLGARGATSGEMNEILKLDDMVTFNPHLTFKSVSESIKVDSDSGVATSAIVRELFSDRSKGKLLPFYKERAKAFYDGFVEEAGFREISDVIRRRTNLQVKKSTGGKVSEFWKDSSIKLRPPLAGLSVNLFQTDCTYASTSGRDGELHFVVLPTIRQRRLVPVPAAVYKSGFLAGYEPSLDATAVSFGTKDKIVSTIFVMPGQQGMVAPGDGLARLEKRLVESSFKKGAWSRLLRTLIPRPNMEVQIPRFSHRSFINATAALKKMGLHDLFDVNKADLRGLNGVSNELFLSDIIQVNSFATCGEKPIGETHHSEIYPASGLSSRNARNLLRYEGDVHKVFHDPLHDPTDFDLPLPLRPRQARIPEVPRLKFDKPFLYYVRHNPTGLILHMGRFNPRLLP